MKHKEQGAVAIVGIGCRFPGGVIDVPSFWRLLMDGRDAISEIPADRIDVHRYFDPTPAKPGRIATRWGGFLDHIEDFDASFFGLSPREADCMDPQQRLLLETAWEALEDAGQDVRLLRGSKTGVFVGQWTSDFEGRLFADPEAIDFYRAMGTGRYAASGRISYAFGLRGPSLTIDCACSSSLVAAHLATRAIRSGEIDAALVGGVNIILQPHITIAYSLSQMMAPDGRCKFGDEAGNGYVRSEGAAVVVLKALSRAMADGNRIYAVIRGGAVNNDGESSGSMGTPSRVGQEELLRTAYRDAGVSAKGVDFVEAHGTGTRAGDPVELGALAAVLGEGRSPGRRAFIGSLKTNVGHTEGAAGIAGLVKATLALYKEVIPGNLHLNNPLLNVPWDKLACEIPTKAVAWPRSDHPRFAGVSSFGIAGTNAHLVLEEGPHWTVPTSYSAPVRAAAILPLSARSPEALRALAGRYRDLMEGDTALHDICWNAATRRSALEQRAVFVARDRSDMLEALTRYSGGGEPTAAGTVHGDAAPKIAFIMPGQGAQWIGMARELMGSEPAFLAALRACDEASRKFIDWSIVEQLSLEPGAASFRLDRIDVIQPILVAIAIAYAELWRSLDIVPDAVVGHSMGEVAAAYVAGVLELEDAMHVVCRRSTFMRRVSGQGAMALVERSAVEVTKRLAGLEDSISLAASNSPRSSVISGEPQAVEQVLASFERDGVFCRRIKVDVASHSPQMNALADELVDELGALSPRKARILIYSTVLGQRASGLEFDAAYWGRNLSQPVLFASAVERMLADGISCFAELGPHPILLHAIEETAHSARAPVTTIASGRREEPEAATLLAAFGKFWTAGCRTGWARLYPQEMKPVRLPLYPWQRRRHWVQGADAVPSGADASLTRPLPTPDERGWLHTLDWQPAQLQPGDARTGTAGRWLILADDGPRAAALSDEFSLHGVQARIAGPHELDDVLKSWLASSGKLGGILALAPSGTEAAYFPVHVLQTVMRHEQVARARLWFVTQGSQSLGAADTLAIDQAALWGAARAISEEHPDLWGGLVDLDPRETSRADLALVVRYVLSPEGEDQIAVRGGSPYALRLSLDAGRNEVGKLYKWRTDAAYLVTGGFGGVGRQVARAMAKAGARRLILVGRTPLPPRDTWNTLLPGTPAADRVAFVRELEMAGVAVHTPAVDVGDEAALVAFLDHYRAEAWPPICGVVHTAVAHDFQLAASLDPSSFNSVLHGKLRAAQVMDRHLPDVDLFVMFSSIGSFLLHSGTTSYAAANAGLDALAHDRRARGLAGLSIGWGPWENAGLFSGEARKRSSGEFARRGVRALESDGASKIFEWLCARRLTYAIVVSMDWQALRKYKASRPLSIFNELLETTANEAGAPDAVLRLAQASGAKRRQILEGLVRDAVGVVLKLTPSQIDPRKALGSMGLTSLMAMELRNRLESALARPLSATLAWNFPTVDALVEFLADEPPEDAHETPVAPVERPSRPLPLSLAPLTELSDDEVIAALRQ